jgi:putative transcriptional regulator
MQIYANIAKTAYNPAKPMQNTTLKAGIFLIAEPFMGDAHFERSVIYLAQHNKQGAFGLVLNQPAPQTLAAATGIGFDPAIKLSVGGPVEREYLFWIHNRPDLIPQATLLHQQLYIGGNQESTFAAVQAGSMPASDIRFFAGYSGWAAGQLEREVARNSWILCPANPALVLGSQEPNFWRQLLKNMGGNYKVLAHYPTDPRLN